MSVQISVTKLAVGGLVGCAISFVVLILGLGAIGGGHGTHTLWLLGLLMCAVSIIALLVGLVFLVKEKRSRKLQIGIVISIIVIIAAGLNFFTITEWIGSRLQH
jgi:4-amino-4-deoxy-L-arabinose transferase-like glycosyltransferase